MGATPAIHIGLLALLALAFFAVFAPWSQAGGSAAGEIGTHMGTVTSVGGALQLDGKPWAPIGFNDYRATSVDGGYVCDESTGAISDDDLETRLDQLEAAGGNVLRTWFFQSYWDPDRDGSGDWKAFDRVLEAAAARHIRVVPVLANHWADCEGTTPQKHLDFYRDGYRRPYADEALSYLEYIRLVVERYAHSGAIAYWQLVNEPEAPSAEGCTEGDAAQALGAFAATAAAELRALDSHTPVSLGTIGLGQCGTASSNFEAVHAAVDLCEMHLYDPTAEAFADAARNIHACAATGKPTVIGELGITPEAGSGGTGGTATLLDQSMDTLRAQGAAGFLLWNMETSA